MEINNAFTKTPRITFDQISGFCGPAKLTHKINRHMCSCYIGMKAMIYLCLKKKKKKELLRTGRTLAGSFPLPKASLHWCKVSQAFTYSVHPRKSPQSPTTAKQSTPKITLPSSVTVLHVHRATNSKYSHRPCPE